MTGSRDEFRDRAAAVRTRLLEGRLGGSEDGRVELRSPVGPRALRTDPLPDASVIVVVRNGEAVIGRCLDCLFAQDHPDFEVIIVDDGSTDRTAEIARERLRAGPLRIVESPGRGISEARNAGLREARGSVVAYVDADGYPEPGWLREACASLERDASAGAVASLVFFDAAPAVVNGAGGTMDIRGHARDLCFGEPLSAAVLPHEVLYPMGNGMVFRRAALDAVGGFDPALDYEYDDAEAGIRLWRAGWRVLLARRAVVDHGYQQGGPGEDRQLRHECHRIRTMITHCPARSLPRWLAGELPWLVIPTEVRRTLQSAWLWNLRRIGSPLLARWRWRRSPPPPRHLIAPGRQKLTELTVPPRPPELYGWFSPQQGRRGAFRWGTRRAARLLEVEERAAGVELTYRLPPRSPGARLEIRLAGELDVLAATDLPPGGWRTERLPAEMGPGIYEAGIASDYAYSDARRRELAVAVRRMELV